MTIRELIEAVVVLVFTSPVDFPLMLLGGEWFPHTPDLSEISDGSWYHRGKGYWAQSARDDGEWWSKLSRFLVWWLAVPRIVRRFI